MRWADDISGEIATVHAPSAAGLKAAVDDLLIAQRLVCHGDIVRADQRIGLTGIADSKCDRVCPRKSIGVRGAGGRAGDAVAKLPQAFGVAAGRGVGKSDGQGSNAASGHGGKIGSQRCIVAHHERQVYGWPRDVPPAAIFSK